MSGVLFYGGWILVTFVALAGAMFVWLLLETLYERWRYGNRPDPQNHRSQTGTTPPAVTVFSGARSFQGASTRVIPRETSAVEITAYRRWQLVLGDVLYSFPGQSVEWRAPTKDALLFSMVIDCSWMGPTLQADGDPAPDTVHGIYALSSLRGLHEYFGGAMLTVPLEGEVALSGTVLEGEVGYRAQYATVRKLWFLWNPVPDERMPELVRQLEDRYQCDVSWSAKEAAA